VTTKPSIGANRANGDVVAYTDWNRDVLQQGNYVQEVLAGSNTDKIPLAALAVTQTGQYPNLLTNPGLEVWQRGVSFGPFTGGASSLTADRWRATASGTAAISVGQSASVDVGSRYAASVGYTHQSGQLGQFYQDLETPLVYACRGKVLTASMRMNAQCSGILRISDGVGNWDTAFATSGGLYQSVTVTSGTISASATLVRVTHIITSGIVGTQLFNLIDNVTLCVAPAAVPYYPLPYSDDLNRCMRYYQQVRCTSRFPSTAASTLYDTGYMLPVPMSDVASSVLTAGTRSNVASVVLGGVLTNGFYTQVTATAGTTAGTDTYSIDDIVTLEAA
jgi:hypothetical protein